MACIQVKPAGRRVLSKTSFWQITEDGRPVGWVTGYQAALSRAAQLEAQATGGVAHACA